MAVTPIFSKLGTLIPVTNQDLKADVKDPDSLGTRPGQYSFMYDELGLRIFRFLRCVTSGGVAAGELQTFVADVQVDNITSGTTTSVTSTGFTADLYKGRLLRCYDDAGAAGAAPEGELRPIVSNTTTIIYIDPKFPFSAAPAANDDFEVINVYDVDDAADGDLAVKVAGISVNGIGTQYNYGWYQCYGMYPEALGKASQAITRGAQIVADAARVNTVGSDGIEMVIGMARSTLESGSVSDQLAVFINVFSIPWYAADTP